MIAYYKGAAAGQRGGHFNILYMMAVLRPGGADAAGHRDITTIGIRDANVLINKHPRELRGGRAALRHRSGLSNALPAILDPTLRLYRVIFSSAPDLSKASR
jgi:hypothetical protein